MYMYINVCINVYILYSKVESHYIYYLETCYLRMFLWIAFDAKRHRSPALSSVATRLCVFFFFFFNSMAISMIEVIWSCFQFSAVVQKGGAAAP